MRTPGGVRGALAAPAEGPASGLHPARDEFVFNQRCGRTGWRSAWVVDGAGLGGGEMGEECLDEFGRLDARVDAQRTATNATVFDVWRTGGDTGGSPPETVDAGR